MTGEKTTMPAMLSRFDEQLSWLSHLQQHYEWTADHERYSDATEDRLEMAVAQRVSALTGSDGPVYGLSHYNDHPDMTAETILLGMKHAREALDV
jgi:hypothetical protein